MEADPKTLLDSTGDNLDPDKVWRRDVERKPAATASARWLSAP